MPLMTLADREKVIGSWFSTGYYGHFRAKSRTDLCNSYRQMAQPVPPKKFLDRQNSDATSHLFSIHDNRLKSEGDPLVRTSTGGFGRRRIFGRTRGDFDPQFLSWTLKNDADASTASEIRSNSELFNNSKETTTYLKDFTHGQPDSMHSKQIRQETYQRFLSTRKRRSFYSQEDQSKNVADCMVWTRPKIDRINSATRSTDALIETLVPLNFTSDQRQTETFRRQSTSSCQPGNSTPLLSSRSFHSPTISTPTGTKQSTAIDSLITKYM